MLMKSMLPKQKLLVFLALFGLTIMGNDAITRAIQSMKLGEIQQLETKDLNFDNVGPALREQFKGMSNIRVSEEIGAVRIEFGEEVLFQSGKAVPKASAFDPIETVAVLLRTLPHTIVVEGHTDSVPMQKNGS
jgi:flagellar motor protein MotB